MYHATKRKRHFLFCWTTNDLPLPVEMKLLFGKQLALPNRPGFTIDFKLVRTMPRSEEHTSELQSPCNLVCRLLLEKKKKQRPRSGYLCDHFTHTLWFITLYS